MKDGFGPERLRFAKTLLGAKIWLKIWKRHNFYNLVLKYINMGVQINRKLLGNSDICLFFSFKSMRRFGSKKTELIWLDIVYGAAVAA